MSMRTKLFQQLPWLGGVNTSTDEAMLPPNQLVQADNNIFDFRGSRKKRDGILYNFGSRPVDPTRNEYGLFEFWFGIASRARRFVSANDHNEIHSYTAGGTATLLGDSGHPWTGVNDQFSFLTFNNLCLIATIGDNNLIKKWNGTEANTSDLRNIYNQKIQNNGRSSSGTTRTLVMTAAFKGVNGDYVVIQNAFGPNAAFYNGTYKVTSVTTTNVANDTITYTGIGNLLETPGADANMIIDGTAPLASVMRQHLGRVWTNDKTNKDRLNYSGTDNHEQWLGFGDSAALDIGIGDGDPEGIIAIFPSFKGQLFVAKRTKLYRVDGYSPETFTVSLVSAGIGCIAHNSIVQVDQDDMFFVSEKGVHSMAASANFGDFNASYLSADIQKTFNENFSKPKLHLVQTAYLSTINSVAFAFCDTNLPEAVNTNLTVNNSVWLYNMQFKTWYRWPDIPCQSMIVGTDGDKKRFYFGTHTGKVIKSFSGNNYDLDYAGAQMQIKFKTVTGQINIDGNFYTVKGFKRFILFYKPQGQSPVFVTVQIDNILQDPVNELAFDEQASGTLLGVDFILGQSILGLGNVKLAAYSRSIEGFGRSVKITIEDSSNQPLEIQGFAIEYEDAGTSPEVILR